MPADPNTPLEGIAIVGMAGRFPGAASIDEFWQVLVEGRETITTFDRSVLPPEEPSGETDYIPRRGVIERPDWFDAAFFNIPPREAETMDPQQRVFLEACWHALENAGCDPAQYGGSIGVFAGMSNNSWLQHRVLPNRELRDQIGYETAMIANEKDYLATRTAYKLNLRGPALNIYTACSTSLVAVCQAVQALQSYQCDAALAGGVSVKWPQERGYTAQEGSIYSPDGHCRPYDAAATGTVFSNGLGVVVLKRLEDAVREGDHIWAVIKGAALNNDGAEKVSFTAPSVDGHAEVIALAQALAGFDPDSIGYVEGHGTATPIGDPIEVAGLTKAFRRGTERTAFCGLGSLKSNMGHMDAASGVAGLIKATLALHHRKLPPTLHFKSPNPSLQLDHTPFFIVDQLRDWNKQSQPRRAGVSSFGVGGTNAHVVLEETPASESVSATLGPQIIVVSAKSSAALDTACDNLASWFESHPDLFADAAWTLQTGRHAFAHRRALAASSAAEASLLLREKKAGVVYQGSSSLPVVLLFPGQGSQHLRMGAAIHAAEPVFRNAFDECADLFLPHLDFDLRTFLHPISDQESLRLQLNDTRFTQPALFAVEYSLAILLTSWGFASSGMLGHSIGEYVAATLAGTLSLTDAVRIVAARARIMGAQERGAMLAVPLPEAEVAARLPDTLDVATINGPAITVVAGPAEEINSFASALEAEGVSARLLHTSHAFHSRMMEPALAEFCTALNEVTLQPPQSPWISNVTGRVITNEEAVSPDYWLRHLRHAVRFGDGIATLCSAGPCLFVECGPGTTLSSLVRRHPAADGCECVSLFPPAKNEGEGEHQALLTGIGKLWTFGAAIDWSKLHPSSRRRVPLPGYPFERQRYCPDAALPGGTQRDGEGWLHYPSSPLMEVPYATAPSPPLPNGNEPVPVAENSPVDRRTHLVSEVRSLLHRTSGIDITTADPAAAFLDLGFDSLFLTQASLALKKHFGIKITFRQLMEQQCSMDALASWLDEKLPPGAFAPAVPVAVPAITAPAASIPDGSVEDRLGRIEQALAKLTGAPVPTTSSTASAAFTVSVREQTGSEGKRIAFGPFRPLQKNVEGGLLPQQQAHLTQLIEDYCARYPKSRQFTADHRPVFADPRAVGGFNPLWKDMVFPAVTNRSEGAYLFDIDGNKWIDVVHGFGSGFFGHKPAFVVEAIKAQLDRGYEIGPTSPLAGEVARLVCEFSGKDRVAFCNTGSEALMAAIRVSRTITGRDRIAMFAGAYHGIFDEVLARPLVSNGELRTIPIAPGIPESAQANIIVLEYGHPESLEIIKRHAHEIAAVLVEPVPSRRPDIAPVEFVQELRRITAEAGTALVFDEVVLGFRTHPNGAQHLFGISADLVSYGKVIGGGMPLGVLAGTRRFMDALDGGQWEYGDDSAPEVGVTFFAGTFIRHPLTIAATRAVLLKLKAEGPALQADNDAKAAAFVQQLGDLFTELGVPVTVTRYSSLWMLHADPSLKHFSLLFYHLRLRGVHIWEGRGNFVSLAHTTGDLAAVLSNFRESILAMQSGGFLPSNTPVAITVPTTPAQREMFLQSQLNTDASLACHESLTICLRGKVDSFRVSTALNRVIARHDALRSSFTPDGLTVSIAPQATWPLRITDAGNDIDRFAEEDFLQPFDLQNGPFVRATLAVLSNDEAHLILTAHHIVCDGWSFGVVVHDFTALYEGRTLPAPASYAAYSVDEAVRRNGAEHGEQREAWQAVFPDVPAPVMLPADHPRTSSPQYAGGMTQRLLPPELVRKLHRFCTARRLTPYHVTLAAFRILVQRLSGQSDFIIGTPSAAQISRNLPDLVGHCVQFLPLRFRQSPDDTGDTVIQSTRDVVLNGSENDGVTFGEILERLALPADKRRNLVPLSFSFEEMPQPVAFADLHGTVVMNPKRRLSFEASFYLQHSEENIALVCAWQTALFDQPTVERWLGNYVTLLQSLIDSPSEPASKLAILTAEEQSELLAGLSVSAAVPADDRCLHVWFEDMAKRYPENTAVCGSGQSLTYLELNQRSNRLARRLREMGIGRESLTGLCLDRTPGMAVAVLAILKAGGAYLPVDPGCPPDRLAFMLADAEAPVLITTQAILTRLPEHSAKTLLLDELDDGSLDHLPDTNLDSINTNTDAAYVIYTSGSTGRPKGCIVTHHNVTRLMRGTEHWYGFSDQDVWTLFHSIAFDFSVWELWGALLYGGRLVVVPFDVSRSPEDFRRLLSDEKVTVLNQTPSAFRQLIRADERSNTPLSLRWVIFGGEALEMESLRPWFNRHGDTTPRLVNMYGITETTVHVTYRPLSLDDLTAGSVIGQPIPDLRLHVLDPDTLTPVPLGVCGEMYVGGDGLARGYLKRPELTAERFIPDHLTGNGRLYKTGDLARLITGASGKLDLEYLGRIDHQVKIRGFRIELGEIESVINTHSTIRESAVFPMPGTGGEQRLVAWLVPNEKAPSHSELRAHLLKKLPDYMVPAAFVMMERFPLTTNGKLDRAALPAPDSAVLATDAADSYVPAQPGTETALAAIWEGVLGRNHIGRSSDFFAIGGTSLNALAVMERVHREFGVKLPLGVLFDAPTLEDFAARIEAATVQPQKAKPIVCIQPEGSGAPLFLLHGGDGGALFYRSLLPKLGTDHPVWVIESPGITDDSWILAHHSIGSCAEEYMKLIRSVYPLGPVILGGYSYGGVVACEMCHLFAEAGQEPELLILFDTENPADGPRELSFTERLAAGWRQGGKGFGSKIKHLSERIGSGLKNRAKYSAAMEGARTLLSEGTVAPDSATRILQIHITHVDALSAFVPRFYDGPVLLFRSDALSDKYARTEDYNWRPCLPELRIVRVSGDHLVLFDEPWADGLAEKLRRELASLRTPLLAT
jgi:amino acid adenylation domain-containing protein